jgi:calpain-7
MKLHGGSYDFRGSNSGIDLFCFTGWIPEQIFFEEDGAAGAGASASRRSSDGGSGGGGARRRPPVLDHRQPAERAWERLRSAFRFGDCLTTIATSGGLDEREAEALGLVPGHAYAVLDVRECLGKRFLLVKNPWARKSWKGPYSAQDRARWTPELCAALGYDPEVARKADDGIFWIDWCVRACVRACARASEGVGVGGWGLIERGIHNPRVHARKWFSNLFLSWDPALFLYRTVTHALWPAAVGPRNDSFSYAQNPQYLLALDEGGGSGSVWILVSRHVTAEEDLEASDYLTLHVYRGSKRVVYPSEQRVCQGVYRCVRALLEFRGWLESVGSIDEATI